MSSTPLAVGSLVQQVQSHNGIFTEVHGDFHNTNNYHIELGNSETGPLGLLRSLSATGAAFDSLDRSPAPKCHPGTRLDLLNEIYTWINDPGRTKLCWVHGPAGAGKSAIAQTVSETCAEQGQLAASFFFSRSAPPRDSSRLFFTTLAWQLASSIPDRRKSICEAVADGVKIIDQHHAAQIERLLVRPLLTLTDSEVGTPPFLIVIDGLDECKPNGDQIRVLNHVYDLLEKHHLPLRFLVVSRPEPHIRSFFDTPRNKDITTEVSIYGDHQAHEDVYLFLRSRFDELAESEQHTHSLKHLSRPWPSEDVVSLLTERSGGYFIYASTVLKYIDEEYVSCVVRLQEVLDASTSGASASIFGELDKLYTQILSTCPNKRLLVRILGGVLAGPAEFGDEVECLEPIYNLHPGEILQTLRGLHSVLEFDLTQGSLSMVTEVRSLHASFLDFLFDKERAGDYYVNHERAFRDLCEGAVSFVRDYESRGSSIESIRSNEYLVFWRLEKLFWYFSSSDEKYQTILLECLDTDTLKKWERSIETLPRLPDTHHLPIIAMLLIGYQEFSEREYPELHLRFTALLNASVRSQLLRDYSKDLQIYLTLSNHIPSLDSENHIFPHIFPTLGLELDSENTRMFDYLCYGGASSDRRTQLSNFLNDPRRSGDLHHPEERCYIHIANCWLAILRERTPSKTEKKLSTSLSISPSRSSSEDEEYALDWVTDLWGEFLSKCPPGEQSLIDHLRNLDPETASKENAELVIEWLKKARNPPLDLLSTWEHFALERWEIPIVPQVTQASDLEAPDSRDVTKPKTSKRSRVRQGFKDAFHRFVNK